MSYRVEFAPSAAISLRKLDVTIQRRLLDKADWLAIHPRGHGVEKLTGREDLHRIRVGDYRMIFAIDDDQRIVTVAVIGHRREAYR